MQQLYPLELLTQQENLSQNQGAVPDDEPVTQRQLRQANAHDICHRGDGRHAELPLFGDGNAHGAEK